MDMKLTSFCLGADKKRWKKCYLIQNMIFRRGRHDELEMGVSSVDMIVSVQGVTTDSLISCTVH